MGKKKEIKRLKTLDPIIKPVRKIKPRKMDETEQDESESESQVRGPIAAEESKYQTFLKTFQMKKKQQISEDQYIAAKHQVKSSKESKFRKVAKYALINTPLEDHFAMDYSLIQKQICDNPISETQIVDEFLQQKESLMNTLNNGITFKDHKIRQELKVKIMVDVNDTLQDFQLDTLAKLTLIQGKHIKGEHLIKEHLIRNYFDYIETDPEEKNSQQFRQLYTSHILNHLLIKRSTFGFTRCKVLILTPFKGDAVDILSKLTQGAVQHNIERFESEFTDEERFQEDDFRLGIAFRKGEFKYYTNFDQADIIVASPLGLKLIIQGGEKDFLASIEILVIDRISGILMQNWAHLETVLGSVNQLPDHKNITTSLDEIRQYFFENMSSFYRQTIIYTNHYFSELNALRSQLNNYKGCISNRLYYPQAVRSTDTISHEFRQIKGDSLVQTAENRFQEFSKIWNEESKGKCIILASQYTEFLKLKSYFKRINSQTVCLSEYTKKPKVQGIIAKFNTDRVKFILITERAYYFEVCQIKKMANIIFYSLPQHAFIYQTMVSDLVAKRSHVISLISRYDAYQLEPLVGTLKAEEMIAKDSLGTIFLV